MTTQTQTGDGEQTAHEAALELGRELSEAGKLATKHLNVHDDKLIDGKASLRLRLPSNAIHPPMLTALGERGFWLEYLGQRGRDSEFAIKTGGSVHEGLY